MVKNKKIDLLLEREKKEIIEDYKKNTNKKISKSINNILNKITIALLLFGNFLIFSIFSAVYYNTEFDKIKTIVILFVSAINIIFMSAIYLKLFEGDKDEK